MLGNVYWTGPTGGRSAIGTSSIGYAVRQIWLTSILTAILFCHWNVKIDNRGSDLGDMICISEGGMPRSARQLAASVGMQLSSGTRHSALWRTNHYIRGPILDHRTVFTLQCNSKWQACQIIRGNSPYSSSVSIKSKPIFNILPLPSFKRKNQTNARSLNETENKVFFVVRVK